MITLVFLSFHSRHLLEKNIKDIISFKLNLPIIIIENSQDYLLKDHYQKEIDAVINFIEAGPGSDGQEFLTKMQRTDAHRKQNFKDTHPEIAQAMGYV